MSQTSLRTLNDSRRSLLTLLALLVLLLGLGIRLVDLTDPPLDFHATRQLRSAILARAAFFQFSHQGTLAEQQLSQNLANLEVYEPPILENLVGGIDVLVGGEYFWIGRIVSAFFWVLGGAALLLAGRRSGDLNAALIGLLFYLFLPFSVIASRSFQPDPWMCAWILFTLLALVRWVEKPDWKRAALAAFLGSVAILIKVFAAFYVGGILVGAAITTYGLKRFWRQAQVWGMGLLMLAPALVYYLLINPQRSGGFLSFWTGSLIHLILTTNFYADWLAMIKNLTGLLPFGLALLSALLAAPALRGVLLGGWLGYGLFGLVFPYQYVTHEYYHLMLVPLMALSLIPLTGVILTALQKQPRLVQAASAIILVFAAFYGAYVSRSALVGNSYENEPESWRRVGEALPPGRPFIALTADYGMRLNYFGWRSPSAMWPSGADYRLFALAGEGDRDLKAEFEGRTAGMDYFLITALGEFENQPELKAHLEANYPLRVEGNGFLVFDLTGKGSR